jgi:hypothetical protein
MASCLIPTSDLTVTREESHCLSAVDFLELDFWTTLTESALERNF